MEKHIAVSRKHSEQIWFVLLTSFFICLTLILLDYIALNGGPSSVAILLLKFTNQIHAIKPNPSFKFSDNPNNTVVDSTVTYSNLTRQVTGNFSGFGEILGNDTENKQDLVHVTIGQGVRNMTEQVSPPPMVADKVISVTKQPETNPDPCSGRYIYMHDLPSRFNEDLLKNCRKLLKWIDMCPYMSNLGLGPEIIDKSGQVLLKNAIFVPYYPGLDVGQYLWGNFNTSMRDASPKALVKWLAEKPEWKKMWGRDHFLIGGRIGFDFRRRSDNDSDWGTKLMFLPEARNMSFLPIESSTYANEFPIPYPTYFHPSSDSEVLQWQRRMRKKKRPYLFSFVGAPRPESPDAIRNELIKQCEFSVTCNFLGCYHGKNRCEDPINVMEVFQSSVFCLQPPGDSYTRRSTFDSILAGCIPVFFHPGSAYDQYLWHLPLNGSTYSVLIPENKVKEKKVLVNETLLRIPKSEVLAMRKKVIKLIPKITYANPKSRLENIEDAFDIAVKGILQRVEKIRRETI
ncbi:xyloglucan galactosyltransferase KATAMARI1-like [Quillaja saponaria]|uniref:Xyloglucan galactosyltransferase KATAMARI1-like n=1 Tax=Quillaja saponaria TaxID=32244 RepID=A0AAD7PJC1_QUISA|nr:xyloglucan galactosyltransferase KATAMARI1-like [Quillaja saponaria]